MKHELSSIASLLAPQALPVPNYLSANYWWAYVHPRAVRLFERQWMVNLILWGNYKRLSNAVLDSFGAPIQGRTLQVACAYGDLTPRLVRRLGPHGRLDVIDILPIQLSNLGDKLDGAAPVRLHHMDSTALAFADASFERTLLFFLLHEQPHEVRLKTLSEALRVLRPGGTLTIVDFAPPAWYNPQRWLWNPLLALLEPFARGLWKEDVASWLPPQARIAAIERRSFFGGGYQMLTLTVA
jgi:ubiquinone/menaquinone biosynthesis C-methylase UbiE